MAENRVWMLDDDLGIQDNLLDEITFDELILTVHCNCPKITPAAVLAEFKNILQIRMDDAQELLTRNIPKIIEKAKEGRE